ncbi:MAG: AsmA family protein, partial [Smithellaceae bacterium]
MALWKKILIGLAVFFVLVSIIGFLILPAVIKPVLIKKMTATLHRQVSVEKISINPYTLSLTVRGFKISEPAASSKNFVAFEELYVNLYGVSSLFQGKLILEEVKLTRPYINIVRREGNVYNFSDLLPKGEKKPAAESKPFYFSLNNIQIIDGSIDFQDTPKKTSHTVRNMNLSIPAISNMEHYVKNYVEPKFSANINGRPFELKGKTKPFLDSRETVFDINISDLDI